MKNNIDKKTVESFGDEWSRMPQNTLTNKEKNKIFNDYFSIFPFDIIDANSIGFDMGCGSGRWAGVISPLVGKLYCIDASSKAIKVAKNNLATYNNIEYILASVGKNNLKIKCDFGYSLGVLHHVPNTYSAIESCGKLLKKNAPFLLYLYYSFDNKPLWYKLVWKSSEIVRFLVNKAPPLLKIFISNVIAIFVYFPLARISKILSIFGLDVSNIPLSYYKDKSFYTMRTDSRDRFGTPLEQRFSKNEIKKMLHESGFKDIKFSENKPYWVVVAYKK